MKKRKLNYRKRARNSVDVVKRSKTEWRLSVSLRSAVPLLINEDAAGTHFVRSLQRLVV